MTSEVLRPADARRPRTRRPTATATFGSSRRESHDSSAFYGRFAPPELSNDDVVATTAPLDVVYCGDARDMTQVATGSVALVVTSPPYFAGKEYEALGAGGVPASYLEYLELLEAVFSECTRVLEPGGRIAVNVANLGRRPYRSLSGDVTQLLSDLGLLLRGEIVWWKGRAAGGSCAWGTFQQPANPVLRDVTERVIVASKGRFDRALRPAERAARGLPSRSTITRDEFLDATTDLWEIPPESASRVGHPAPYPVELPQRLIELYTYEGDVVLDPFMGAGSTGVAAVRCRRRFLGFETDAGYVDRALERIGAERHRLLSAGGWRSPVGGRKAKELAAALLAEAGFSGLVADARVGGGLSVGFTATDPSGRRWSFDVAGGFTSVPSGLRRGETLWRVLGRAAVLHEVAPEMPHVVLTTDLPPSGSAVAAALRALTGPGKAILAVVELAGAGSDGALRRLVAGDD